MSCVALAAWLTMPGACSFNGVDPGGQDGGPNGDGAMGADGARSDGGPACGFGLVSDRVDLATAGAVQPALVLGGDDVWTLEADDAVATFVSENGAPDLERQGVLVSQPNGADILVIYVQNFQVQSEATLRLVGVHPVAFVADDAVIISGTIDVSSDRGDREGAGSLASGQCGGRQPGNGVEAGGTAGGGGGGGHGSAGEAGGSGNSGAEAGGSLGAARNSLDFPLGGCGGGNGGTSADAGEGGLGGGVVEVIARCQLTVTGEIDAGGAGGRPAQSNNLGGGGGGSGGFIGLQSPQMRLVGGAFLAANGGGGAEGRNGESGSNGDDGEISLDGGDGGNGNDGGNGGDGAGQSGGPEIGTDSAGGGGGGGGGVGFIMITSADLENNATFSPPPDIN